MTEAALAGRNAPVIEQVGNLDPAQFDRWVDNLLNVGMEIKSVVSKQVTNGTIGTYQGAGILACTMGQLFGYQDFHNPTSPHLLQQDNTKR